jgi:hypothetical protein
MLEKVDIGFNNDSRNEKENPLPHTAPRSLASPKAVGKASVKG